MRPWWQSERLPGAVVFVGQEVVVGFGCWMLDFGFLDLLWTGAPDKGDRGNRLLWTNTP